MERKEVLLRGINRNSLAGMSEPGDCLEAINIRKHNGKWVGVKGKKSIKTLTQTYSAIYVHKSDTTTITLGFIKSSGELWRIDDSSASPIHTFSTNIDVRFGGLGNILMLFDDTNKVTHHLLYRLEDLLYKYIGAAMPPPVSVDFARSEIDSSNVLLIHGTANDYNWSTEDKAILSLDAILAKEYAKWKKDGWFNGFILVRTAYELYDGSYTGFSEPNLLYIYGQYQTSDPLTSSDFYLHKSDNIFSFRIMPGRLSFLVGSKNSSIISSLQDYKDIIKGLAIFISKPSDRYGNSKYGAETNSLGNPDVSSGLFHLEADSDNTPDVNIDNLLYKVKTILLDDLEVTSTYEVIKDDLLEIHTKDSLPIENTSHTLFGDFCMTYNSRIWMQNIKTTFNRGNGPAVLGGVTAGMASTIVFEYKIKTAQGNVFVRSESFSASLKYLYLPFLLFYPDSRAVQFRILVKLSGQTTFKIAFTQSLTPHSIYNYSFAFVGDLMDYLMYSLGVESNDFISLAEAFPRSRECDVFRMSRSNTNQCKWRIADTAGNSPAFIDAYTPLPVASEIPSESLVDRNRVQASEIGNPFVLPEKNSYQVGTGAGVAMGANVIPLSDLQFGQHPVIVFSESGIWALEIGIGDVLVTRIIPISTEVCNSSKVASVGNMVFFISTKGLHAIYGKDVKHVSIPIEGGFESPLTDELSEFICKHQFPSTEPRSSVDFLTYLSGAILIADYSKDELIVSNSSYAYSYIFNTTSGEWYKRSDSFRISCSSWPDSYAIQSTSLRKITEEDGVNLPIYIETRDINMGVYVKINRLSMKAGMKRKVNAQNVILSLYSSGRPESNHLLSNSKANKTLLLLDELVLTRSIRSGMFFRILFSGDLDTFTMGRILMDIERKWDKL